jgi:hypothetical protein
MPITNRTSAKPDPEKGKATPSPKASDPSTPLVTSPSPAVPTTGVAQSIEGLGFQSVRSNGEGAITGLDRKREYFILQVTPGTEVTALPECVRRETGDSQEVRCGITLSTIQTRGK